VESVTEEEPEQGSGCAGAAVITMAVSTPLAILYAASREAFILALGAVGWGSIIWAAYHTPKSVQDAPDRTPPAPSERGPEEEQQVIAVRDTSHPNRWATPRRSRWLTEPTQKES
jgi:hypothetical protein